jgi:predicted ribosomally synthesized peptide with nif11-like leader
MSQETVKSFFDFARNSEEIQRQFKNGISCEGIIKIASDNGYGFNEEELQKHLKEDRSVKVSSNKEELSELELEAVSGGGLLLLLLFLL